MCVSCTSIQLLVRNTLIELIEFFLNIAVLWSQISTARAQNNKYFLFINLIHCTVYSLPKYAMKCKQKVAFVHVY